MRSPFDDYVSTDKAGLYGSPTPKRNEKPFLNLLWGDGVEVIEVGTKRTKVRCRGRDRQGWVDNDCLGGKSLLEYYFIDVGQGDGVLIKTPDFQHILIDGGWPRANQDTGKNAADFVDWKFFEDYAKSSIEIDVMICSHNDADHYGGLWDLLNTEYITDLDCGKVLVKDFYHAGLGYWKKASGTGRTLGNYEPAADGDTYFTQLMSDRDSLAKALSGQGEQLAGEWAKFMQCVYESTWKAGKPTSVNALFHSDEYVPGFESNTSKAPAMKVLAPVEFEIFGKPAVRRFTGGDSQNTNGNSIMLRVDYGRTRTILTGDLNKQSQSALLKDYAGETQELECDIAKACHHGSEDISYGFLQRLRPAVTIISSGDNEGHDHPRPNIVAASATTGYFELDNDELVTPLIYSTELARSVSFGTPERLTVPVPNSNDLDSIEDERFKNTRVHYKETKSGERNPRARNKTMKETTIVAGLIYGLVNVRTDGETILCATLDEKDYDWRINKIKSRF